MCNIIEILKNNNVEVLKDFFVDKELEFYDNDMKDIRISLGFSIPNYNELISLLRIYDNVEPCESEMFAQGLITNVINLYTTNVSNLYLARKEQFGLRDEDAIITELIFTSDVKNIIY